MTPAIISRLKQNREQAGLFPVNHSMRSFSLPTKLYLFAVYALGLVVLLLQIGNMRIGDPWLLVILCTLASLALILKVEGSSNRPHYTFSFVVYGFTLATFGIGTTVLVILVSHLVERMWSRPPWFLLLLNMSAYLVAAEVAGIVYLWVYQTSLLPQGKEALAIAIGMAVFALVNHLLVSILLWMGRKERFKSARAFDSFALVLDVSLLYFGACLSIVWEYNPFAVVLFIVPTHLLYSALRVPALERKTELDSKTGLFNHAYFKRQLESELSRSNRFERPLSVIIADLDLLRNINNTYGHLAGDEVLIGVARAMKQSVREYDIVSRFGGEEFAILLPETTLVQAYEKAEFFRKTIETMEFIIPTSMTPIRATMSFGVAHRENRHQTPNEIVHNADLALYNSKLRGRNRTFAHANNMCVDFQADVEERDTGAAGFELNPPGA